MRWSYLAALVLAACQGSDAKPGAAPEPISPAQSAKLEPAPIPSSQGDPVPGWWEAEHPCLDGASLSGAGPPNGGEIWCELPDGRKHGRASKWSRLGTLKAEGEHRNGTKHGTFTAYHGNGRLSMRAQFVDGKEHGPITTWHSNGAKALEGAYKDGKGSGPWQKWDRDGKLIGEGDYDVAPPD